MLARLKRWRWALLIAALLAAGLAFAFWPQPSPVDTARVTSGKMTVGITDDGVTRAREYYVVSAPVTGYLSRIELEVGDSVARGALITQMTGRPSSPLDPRSQQELRAALAAARASESGAGASLAQARRDLARAEALAQRGFLPRAQLEAARTRVSTGQAALAQARAEIARIDARLAAPTGAVAGGPVAVRAPAAGSVLSVINESAGVIAEGTPLVTIGDARRIEAVVDLLSREAVRVKAGDRVEITQWGGDAPLIGHVARIEPFGRLKVSALGIEEQRVNVIVAFDAASAPEAARLGHGYQIDATIVLWSRADALRVPIGALFRGPDGGWRVFVVDHGRARARPVKLGHVNDEFGEVLAGLAVNQQVVVNPGNALADGARIKPR
ncbi:efflux RND transporter periplasmic adaptor subunit [Novosphingobium sp. KCTC 2891]|uniref:efflux RND transporter periplasmic adaptor subunit n=1 Tax=Novosphingobium sp. KCTC 2891 TaxID=2989730 RepID=UPI0022213BBB|nr:efflux RND transporter periplasmic adaptor subunit [Novosphingobium sp. KCTC 2891]MCW1383900.1 efflux RND transporter periplasmic adaptor subunit [Novosphingobium sp. KCTC 2891]